VRLFNHVLPSNYTQTTPPLLTGRPALAESSFGAGSPLLSHLFTRNSMEYVVRHGRETINLLGAAQPAVIRKIVSEDTIGTYIYL